ncbi:hypothetical protein SNE40_007844 [Patella caerulea]|uniref:Uncharacterized protein n=1 Tax=Patella caerulea TaxID=87958 RepID=A0AAN8JZY4_PATCE
MIRTKLHSNHIPPSTFGNTRARNSINRLPGQRRVIQNRPILLRNILGGRSTDSNNNFRHSNGQERHTQPDNVSETNQPMQSRTRNIPQHQQLREGSRHTIANVLPSINQRSQSLRNQNQNFFQQNIQRQNPLHNSRVRQNQLRRTQNFRQRPMGRRQNNNVHIQRRLLPGSNFNRRHNRIPQRRLLPNPQNRGITKNSNSLYNQSNISFKTGHHIEIDKPKMNYTSHSYAPTFVNTGIFSVDGSSRRNNSDKDLTWSRASTSYIKKGVFGKNSNGYKEDHKSRKTPKDIKIPQPDLNRFDTPAVLYTVDLKESQPGLTNIQSNGILTNDTPAVRHPVSIKESQRRGSKRGRFEVSNFKSQERDRKFQKDAIPLETYVSGIPKIDIVGNQAMDELTKLKMQGDHTTVSTNGYRKEMPIHNYSDSRSLIDWIWPGDERQNMKFAKHQRHITAPQKDHLGFFWPDFTAAHRYEQREKVLKTSFKIDTKKIENANPTSTQLAQKKKKKRLKVKRRRKKKKMDVKVKNDYVSQLGDSLVKYQPDVSTQLPFNQDTLSALKTLNHNPAISHKTENKFQLIDTVSSMTDGILSNLDNIKNRIPKDMLSSINLDLSFKNVSQISNLGDNSSTVSFKLDTTTYSTQLPSIRNTDITTPSLRSTKDTKPLLTAKKKFRKSNMVGDKISNDQLSSLLINTKSIFEGNEHHKFKKMSNVNRVTVPITTTSQSPNIHQLGKDLHDMETMKTAEMPIEPYAYLDINQIRIPPDQLSVFNHLPGLNQGNSLHLKNDKDTDEVFFTPVNGTTSPVSDVTQGIGIDLLGHDTPLKIRQVDSQTRDISVEMTTPKPTLPELDSKYTQLKMTPTLSTDKTEYKPVSISQIKSVPENVFISSLSSMDHTASSVLSNQLNPTLTTYMLSATSNRQVGPEEIHTSIDSNTNRVVTSPSSLDQFTHPTDNGYDSRLNIILPVKNIIPTTSSISSNIPATNIIPETVITQYKDVNKIQDSLKLNIAKTGTNNIQINQGTTDFRFENLDSLPSGKPIPLYMIDVNTFHGATETADKNRIRDVMEMKLNDNSPGKIHTSIDSNTIKITSPSSFEQFTNPTDNGYASHPDILFPSTAHSLSTVNATIFYAAVVDEMNISKEKPVRDESFKHTKPILPEMSLVINEDKKRTLARNPFLNHHIKRLYSPLQSSSIPFTQKATTDHFFGMHSILDMDHATPVTPSTVQIGNMEPITVDLTTPPNHISATLPLVLPSFLEDGSFKHTKPIHTEMYLVNNEDRKRPLARNPFLNHQIQRHHSPFQNSSIPFTQKATTDHFFGMHSILDMDHATPVTTSTVQIGNMEPIIVDLTTQPNHISTTLPSILPLFLDEKTNSSSWIQNKLKLLENHKFSQTVDMLPQNREYQGISSTTPSSLGGIQKMVNGTKMESPIYFSRNSKERVKNKTFTISEPFKQASFSNQVHGGIPVGVSTERRKPTARNNPREQYPSTLNSSNIPDTQKIITDVRATHSVNGTGNNSPTSTSTTPTNDRVSQAKYFTSQPIFSKLSTTISLFDIMTNTSNAENSDKSLAAPKNPRIRPEEGRNKTNGSHVIRNLISSFEFTNTKGTSLQGTPTVQPNKVNVTSHSQNTNFLQKQNAFETKLATSAFRFNDISTDSPSQKSNWFAEEMLQRKNSTSYNISVPFSWMVGIKNNVHEDQIEEPFGVSKTLQNIELKGHALSDAMQTLTVIPTADISSHAETTIQEQSNTINSILPTEQSNLFAEETLPRQNSTSYSFSVQGNVHEQQIEKPVYISKDSPNTFKVKVHPSSEQRGTLEASSLSPSNENQTQVMPIFLTFKPKLTTSTAENVPGTTPVVRLDDISTESRIQKSNRSAEETLRRRNSTPYNTSIQSNVHDTQIEKAVDDSKYPPNIFEVKEHALSEPPGALEASSLSPATENPTQVAPFFLTFQTKLTTSKAENVQVTTPPFPSNDTTTVSLSKPKDKIKQLPDQDSFSTESTLSTEKLGFKTSDSTSNRYTSPTVDNSSPRDNPSAMPNIFKQISDVTTVEAPTRKHMTTVKQDKLKKLVLFTEKPNMDNRGSITRNPFTFETKTFGSSVGESTGKYVTKPKELLSFTQKPDRGRGSANKNPFIFETTTFRNPFLLPLVRNPFLARVQNIRPEFVRKSPTKDAVKINGKTPKPIPPRNPFLSPLRSNPFYPPKQMTNPRFAFGSVSMNNSKAKKQNTLSSWSESRETNVFNTKDTPTTENPFYQPFSQTRLDERSTTVATVQNSYGQQPLKPYMGVFASSTTMNIPNTSDKPSTEKPYSLPSLHAIITPATVPSESTQGVEESTKGIALTESPSEGLVTHDLNLNSGHEQILLDVLKKVVAGSGKTGYNKAVETVLLQQTQKNILKYLLARVGETSPPKLPPSTTSSPISTTGAFGELYDYYGEPSEYGEQPLRNYYYYY